MGRGGSAASEGGSALELLASARFAPFRDDAFDPASFASRSLTESHTTAQAQTEQLQQGVAALDGALRQLVLNHQDDLIAQTARLTEAESAVQVRRHRRCSSARASCWWRLCGPARTPTLHPVWHPSILPACSASRCRCVACRWWQRACEPRWPSRSSRLPRARSSCATCRCVLFPAAGQDLIGGLCLCLQQKGWSGTIGSTVGKLRGIAAQPPPTAAPLPAGRAATVGHPAGAH